MRGAGCVEGAWREFYGGGGFVSFAFWGAVGRGRGGYVHG